MRVDILTLFPEAFAGPLDVSILKRAREAGLLDLVIHNIRDHATGRHQSVDDYPFGGGPGMVMRVDVLARAIERIAPLAPDPPHVIYFTPQGEPIGDRLVRDLARRPRLVLVCGRYEGVDERFIDGWVHQQVSLGDFIVTGGELPAMVLVDAVTRHVPGALGDSESPEDESFADGFLEHPQYTRPAEFEGRPVPPILLSGDHAAIDRWRQEQRLLRTARRRPDLLGDTSPERPSLKSSGVRIRTGQLESDLDAVLALWRRAGPGIKLGPSDEPAEIARKLTRDPDLFVVAMSGRRIAGAVLGGWDGRRGYVYHLAVDAPFRSRGVGTALMQELGARLRLKGCTRMHLVVPPGALPAVRFYERLGWVQTGNIQMARDTDFD
ncbi:MAG: tRNA (guanosine(37)-N1)-methyltransferase TrmD [Dehalococcoidia bacterium]|nr:tRNA (guanosine(37)-N1)-methyltransferase TrmD [Dehalococcoidia bacterium]MCB9485445.1 tRNA (guanosine(37)-N1)-methyltransferase TrmD [Thermoflexaceae bacterium]